MEGRKILWAIHLYLRRSLCMTFLSTSRHHCNIHPSPIRFLFTIHCNPRTFFIFFSHKWHFFTARPRYNKGFIRTTNIFLKFHPCKMVTFKTWQGMATDHSSHRQNSLCGGVRGCRHIHPYMCNGSKTACNLKYFHVWTAKCFTCRFICVRGGVRRCRPWSPGSKWRTPIFCRIHTHP